MTQRYKSIYSSLLFTVLITMSIGLTVNAQETVTDIDGNVYNTVTIGDQVWMASNLITTKYNDGTPIPLFETSDNTAWAELTSGGRASYRDTTRWGEAYGYLYNWYAVTDAKGICPTGWRVPSIGDFNDLLFNAGMAASDTSSTGKITEDNLTAGKLKGTSTEGDPQWKSNADATDDFGFSWYGGGVKYATGVWGPNDYYKEWGALWSSSLDTDTKAWRIIALNSDGYIRKNSGLLTLGTTVRCVMDASSTSNEEIEGQPKEFDLEQNYPNPFNPSTLISYSVPEISSVKITVYDMLGREIGVLVNETKSAGIYSVNFNASGLSSGVYIYRLQTGSNTITKRMTLLK